MKTKRTSWLLAIMAVCSVALLGLTGCGDDNKHQNLSQSYEKFVSDDS